MDYYHGKMEPFKEIWTVRESKDDSLFIDNIDQLSGFVIVIQSSDTSKKSKEMYCIIEKMSSEEVVNYNLLHHLLESIVS